MAYYLTTQAFTTSNHMTEITAKGCQMLTLAISKPKQNVLLPMMTPYVSQASASSQATIPSQFKLPASSNIS
eukprot:3252065-Amphidinium_carterae.2